nr:hypothetical protein [Trentepohlia sp. YN1317]
MSYQGEGEVKKEIGPPLRLCPDKNTTCKVSQNNRKIYFNKIILKKSLRPSLDELFFVFQESALSASLFFPSQSPPSPDMIKKRGREKRNMYQTLASEDLCSKEKSGGKPQNLGTKDDPKILEKCDNFFFKFPKRSVKPKSLMFSLR